jgi:menaquinone-dependent protoporphyrinogen oxidase
MNVLVAYVSKHGSTHGMAEAIAVQLRMADFDTDLRELSEISSVEGYGAVIIGTAVYMGHTMDGVKEFIAKHKAELSQIPVWFFSSGPIGKEPKPVGEAVDVADLVAAINARDHKVFPGKIDKHQLNLGERIAARVVGAPEGDFRDWDAVESWAREIAHSLSKEQK